MGNNGWMLQERESDVARINMSLSSLYLSLNIFYCPVEAIQDCNTWLRSEKKVSDACGVMV